MLSIPRREAEPMTERRGGVARTCDVCDRSATWNVQHVEYADHLAPNGACARHLTRVCRESEYGDGDELYVWRVAVD